MLFRIWNILYSMEVCILLDRMQIQILYCVARLCYTHVSPLPQGSLNIPTGHTHISANVIHEH